MILALVSACMTKEISQKLPEELQQEVAELVEELKAGKITIPTTIN